MPSLTYGATGSQQTITFTHPRQLAQIMPPPPRQPLASWATDLAAVVALLTVGTNAAFEEALRYVDGGYFQLATTDVPGGVLAALKTYIQQQRPGAPGYLAGGSTWYS